MPNEAQVTCAACGSEFDSQQQLDLHRRDQHNEGKQKPQIQAGQQYSAKGQEQDGR